MGRRWALSSVAAWCVFLAPEAVLPVKFQFEVSADQAGMKIVDFAAGPDRLYFLFTGAEKSELMVFDFRGRLAGGVTLKSRASRIAPACAHGGVLVIRPRPAGESYVEEYSPDLELERDWTYRDESSHLLCSGKEVVPLGPGRLPFWENEPVLLAPAGKDSFVVIQVFSGILRRVGLDGVVRTQRAMSGPGLDAFRADLTENEGLFGFAAADRKGVYVVLGRSSPATGVAVQKYDFEGNYVGEFRLPSLSMNGIVVRGDTIYVVDFRDRRVVAFDCGGICSNSIP